MRYLFSFLFLFYTTLYSIDDPKLIPVNYQGRYIPLEIYAKLIDKDLDTLLATQLPTLKILPTRSSPLFWVELNHLLDPHSRLAFKERDVLQAAYLSWLKNPTVEGGRSFAKSYFLEYEPLTQIDYPLSKSSTMRFPSITLLQIERFYQLVPLASFIIFGYLLSGILSLCQFKRAAMGTLLISFVGHTALLLMRSLILGRPPVANMAETLIYVPWIIVTLALGLFLYFRIQVILPTAAFLAALLLSILELTFKSHTLENIQPVLNSSFWLTIHVLMIVASYGAFILAGLLAHYSLLYRLFYTENSPAPLLQLLYVGVALLIPGTILGGVWAAQSWGRFWDWDPKESWAFISAMSYLILIHTYRFKKIGSFGLEIGAVVGMLIITFTWYGVNYILGTGLHSYGFGSGGEWVYFFFIFFEIIFIISILTLQKNSFRKKIFLQNTRPKD